MQSLSPSPSAHCPRTPPLCSPLPVSNLPSSPLSASRDTSTSPLPLPDITRSPTASSIDTSAPQSPLTPANSSPRSFRSISSQQHPADTHPLLSASPLSSAIPSSPLVRFTPDFGVEAPIYSSSPTQGQGRVVERAVTVPRSSPSRDDVAAEQPYAAVMPAAGTVSPFATDPPPFQSQDRIVDDILDKPIDFRQLISERPREPTASSAGSGACAPTSVASDQLSTSPSRFPVKSHDYASPTVSFTPTDSALPPVQPLAAKTSPVTLSVPATTPISSSQSSQTSPITPQTPAQATVRSLQSSSQAQVQSRHQPQTPAAPSSQVNAPAGAPALAHPAIAGTPGGTDFRTPNVYINGLPPNFPEEELFKMTREFGTVVSVRTFTRHVCDKPSGYGFVLFESIDAAEKCIESLRKYRNLHPSYSKQIHKIPGTIYSSPTFQAVAGAQDAPADSFKARMEQLRDNSSTNLYMEGLPLSIDEMTLAALVKPYKICSNRFFQTRLSNPPRMIAFVRFESRVAAEEIIERLHGRIIRGLDDAGARISVRFADTSEQRELRRMERTGREGEQSPGRLSMAQAALLNLKGSQVHPQMPISPVLSPEFGRFQPGANLSTLLTGGQLPTLRNPLSPTTLPLQQQQGLLQSRMRELSLAGHGYDDLQSNASSYLRQDLRIPQRTMQDELLALQDARAQLQLAQGLGLGAAARADNGFTPMERMLLQAHAERQAEQQLLEAQQQLQLRSQGRRRLLDALQSGGLTAEEEFHAGAAGTGMGQIGNGLGQRQRNQTHASSVRIPEVSDAGLGQAMHLRSTTLPSQYLSSRSLDGRRGFAGNGSSQSLVTNTNAAVASGAGKNAFNVGIGSSSAKPSAHGVQNLSVPTFPRTSAQGLSAQGFGHGVAVHEADSDEDGAPLVSPALTFSPRTPATLSPATPFGGWGEAFDGPGMVQVGVHAQGEGKGGGVEEAKKKAGAQVQAQGQGASVKRLHV